MIDERPYCESRSEAISLLAAGCLKPEEEKGLRQHLTTCSVCLERLEQSISVCSGLRSAGLASMNFEASALVSRVMAEISATNAGTAKSNDCKVGANFLAFFGLEAILAHSMQEPSRVESCQTKVPSSSTGGSTEIETGTRLMNFFGLPVAY